MNQLPPPIEREREREREREMTFILQFFKNRYVYLVDLKCRESGIKASWTVFTPPTREKKKEKKKKSIIIFISYA